MQCCCATDFI